MRKGKEVPMRELPAEFVGVGEVRGFQFRQVSRTDFGYIYEVVMPDSGLRHWEVFRRVENVRFDCVSYPKSKSFGAWAWCCSSYEKAKSILASFSAGSEPIEEEDETED